MNSTVFENIVRYLASILGIIIKNDRRPHIIVQNVSPTTAHLPHNGFPIKLLKEHLPSTGPCTCPAVQSCPHSRQPRLAGIILSLQKSEKLKINIKHNQPGKYDLDLVFLAVAAGLSFSLGTLF